MVHLGIYSFGSAFIYCLLLLLALRVLWHLGNYFKNKGKQ